MDTGFVWDESKYRQVIEKHNVRFYEVVAAFDDRHGYEMADPKGGRSLAMGWKDTLESHTDGLYTVRKNCLCIA